MSNKQNIPRLRFPEFKDLWKEMPIGDLPDKNIKYGIVDGPFGSNLKTIHYKTEGIPIITSGFVTNGFFKADNYIYVTEEKFEKEKRSAVKGGDIVMAKIGARCGASAILPLEHNEGILSGNALKISVDIGRFSSYFIWLKLLDLHNNFKLDVLKTVGAQPAISISNLKKFCISVPRLQEQEKIASFLTAVDEKINFLQKKKKGLEQYKKGVMQQLFSQKLRFKKEDGSDYPDWEEKKLGDLCSIKTGKLDANAMVENGDYRFYTCAKDYYRIDQYAFDTEALLISGNGANVGYIHYYKGKFNAYQRTYVLDSFVQNIQYIKYFLDKNLYERIRNEKKEGNTPYIVLGTLKEMVIAVPNLMEQTKISNFLNNIDNKITFVETQLGNTKQFKKGLLQQMFV